jgi:hypothetical protein
MSPVQVDDTAQLRQLRRRQVFRLKQKCDLILLSAVEMQAASPRCWSRHQINSNDRLVEQLVGESLLFAQ